MRIKEEDEWKVAFSMPKSVYKLTVMFFGLTNSLTTFQIMIKNLLRDMDMIEVVDVVAFIDDVMVEMETEEWHDNIVKKVLRRIVENYLFVKPEKYIWKIREIGFLKVVIEPDEVKIEKEKVQEIVDWSVLKSVKDMQKFLELANYYKWFVKDFARIAKSLHEMTRKEAKWN